MNSFVLYFHLLYKSQPSTIYNVIIIISTGYVNINGLLVDYEPHDNMINYIEFIKQCE